MNITENYMFQRKSLGLNKRPLHSIPLSGKRITRNYHALWHA